jgi:hypothetical protein
MIKAALYGKCSAALSHPNPSSNTVKNHSSTLKNLTTEVTKLAKSFGRFASVHTEQFGQYITYSVTYRLPSGYAVRTEGTATAAAALATFQRALFIGTLSKN